MAGTSKILAQIAIRNHMLLRNGLFSTTVSRSAAANHLVKLKTLISPQCQPPALMCSEKNIPTVYYAEVKDLPNHPEKLLIDVRERDEIQFGKIHHSVNIPLSEISTCLAKDVTDEKFQNKYGIPKPNVDTYIIVYCRTGTRSVQAAETLVNLGYKNVHDYSGSWVDYIANETEQ